VGVLVAGNAGGSGGLLAIGRGISDGEGSPAGGADLSP